MNVVMIDSRSAVEHPGYELADIDCIPAEIFAIAVPWHYAMQATRAMNQHARLLQAVREIRLAGTYGASGALLTQLAEKALVDLMEAP